MVPPKHETLHKGLRVSTGFYRFQNGRLIRAWLRVTYVESRCLPPSSVALKVQVIPHVTQWFSGLDWFNNMIIIENILSDNKIDNVGQY
ncbi:hypothetical protein PhaeoP72_01744 [Phaeobacter inhibens]|nr:hypothetical protein PhaeoP72_01744 [Phaeobacter inhibens]